MCSMCLSRVCEAFWAWDLGFRVILLYGVSLLAGPGDLVSRYKKTRKYPERGPNWVYDTISLHTKSPDPPSKKVFFNPETPGPETQTHKPYIPKPCTPKPETLNSKSQNPKTPNPSMRSLNCLGFRL